MKSYILKSLAQCLAESKLSIHDNFSSLGDQHLHLTHFYASNYWVD